MNRIVLQIPVDRNLRDIIKKRAKEYGFSSPQALIRYFLKKLAAGKVEVSMKIKE
ncbi:MAG: hypothetical protein HYU80_00205 [Candidatus Blackburnbacteria bacterium]|nr:hypothetical protein [Candidatus Blackburnbacteria bacterium]